MLWADGDAGEEDGEGKLLRARRPRLWVLERGAGTSAHRGYSGSTPMNLAWRNG